MISNHYALTYGAHWNWLVLIAMSFAGAAIRTWFVMRHKAHERSGKTSPVPLALGLIVLAGVIAALAPRTSTSTQGAVSDPAAAAQRFVTVQSIIHQRCVTCHAPTPSFAGFTAPPKGVLLDTPEHILTHAITMQTQLATRVMPIGNITQMTDAERETVLAWLKDGAPR